MIFMYIYIFLPVTSENVHETNTCTPIAGVQRSTYSLDNRQVCLIFNSSYKNRILFIFIHEQDKLLLYNKSNRYTKGGKS
jgi:hypothetical protein